MSSASNVAPDTLSKETGKSKKKEIETTGRKKKEPKQKKGVAKKSVRSLLLINFENSEEGRRHKS